MTGEQAVTGRIRAFGVAINRRHINSQLSYRSSVYVNHRGGVKLLNDSVKLLRLIQDPFSNTESR